MNEIIAMVEQIIFSIKNESYCKDCPHVDDCQTCLEKSALSSLEKLKQKCMDKTKEKRIILALNN